MPTFISSYSFSRSGRHLESDKHDPEVNSMLQRLQEKGGQVQGIKVRLSGDTALCLIM
jgi:hypothetical protein